MRPLVCSSSTRVTQLLAWAWLVAAPIMMIGQITALRNAYLSIVALATLLVFGRTAWRTLPAKLPWILVLLWCSMSVFWSGVPDVTAGKLRTDLFLPFLVYWAAYAIARKTGALLALTRGVALGMGLLAALSIFVWAPKGVLLYMDLLGVPLATFPSLGTPLPRWYPGVGDASTVALFSSTVLLIAPTVFQNVKSGIWVASWCALVIIVTAAGNRSAIVLLPISVLALAWRAARAKRSENLVRRSRTRVVAVITAVLLVIFAAGISLEYSARDRLSQLHVLPPGGGSAILTMIRRDTRPFIWSYYVRLARREPLIGVGFGRTVPGIYYKTEQDADLAKVENNAYIHAHNIFLNWWLQTGAIGVALFAGLLFSIATSIGRLERVALANGIGSRLSGSSRLQPSSTRKGVRAIASASYALLALMLLRNLTDDFLVFGVASLFWALMGALLGELQRNSELP